MPPVNDAVEAKAHLYRENGRWVLSLDLPVWLTNDLTQELRGHALVDMPPVITGETSIELEFIQLPLSEEKVSCDNCGAVVQVPKIVEPPPKRSKLWSILSQA